MAVITIISLRFVGCVGRWERALVVSQRGRSILPEMLINM